MLHDVMNIFIFLHQACWEFSLIKMISISHLLEQRVLFKNLLVEVQLDITSFLYGLHEGCLRKVRSEKWEVRSLFLFQETNSKSCLHFFWTRAGRKTHHRCIQVFLHVFRHHFGGFVLCVDVFEDFSFFFEVLSWHFDPGDFIGVL